MKIAILPLSILLTLALALCGMCTVIYVKSDSPGPAFDGTSWDSAFHTIQAGIDAAISGDEVWVAAGTYVECITLKDGVSVYGGFTDSCTSREERDPEVNVTIIDGNLGTDIVTALAGITTSTVIDGFTIKNGSKGVYCNAGSPTVSNNVIKVQTEGVKCANSSAIVSSNRIECYGTGTGIRSGVVCLYSGSPIVTGNTVTGSFTRGLGCGNTGCSPTFSGNIVNGVAGYGIYCSSSSPIIDRNTISANSLAGIYCTGSTAAPTITFNRISGNTFEGICLGSPSTSPMLIANNIISGNAGSGIGGYGSPIIANNVIRGNTAGLNTRNGLVDDGGAIWIQGSPSIINNTITNNTASSAGVIYCTGTASTVINNIIAFNSSGVGVPAGVVQRNNCIFGNTSMTGLTSGDIQVDPELADTATGNIHLTADSPCIDTGDDSVLQADWTDVDGTQRLFGGHVDIGADEFVGNVPFKDLRIIRVRPDGNDANDGSSWSKAMKTIQTALDNAAIDGGEVWVKDGLYKERLLIHAYSYLYGGFDGDETERSQRDWKQNICILDGEELGTVVTIASGNLVSTLDGFTICNGSGTYYAYGIGKNYRHCGGGILCEFASSTIANNIITNNAINAISGTYVRSIGGGICCIGDSIIENNVIAGNSADLGAGICLSSSSGRVSNNIIKANVATQSGGGMHAYGVDLISNNTFCNNTAPAGGAISLTSSTLSNNIITNNSSGIYAPSIRNVPPLRWTC